VVGEHGDINAIGERVFGLTGAPRLIDKRRIPLFGYGGSMICVTRPRGVFWPDLRGHPHLRVASGE